MPEYLFYNNEWLPTHQPLIPAGNRGFRYGHGLFETCFAAQGAIRLGRYHFERLFAGMELLGLRLPDHYTPGWLTTQIATLCEKNGHSPARVRLTVFRGSGNLFDADLEPAHCIIESQMIAGEALYCPPLQGGDPEIQSSLSVPLEGKKAVNEGKKIEGGLSIGIFPHARKAPDAFSHLKSNNYLPSALAANYARERQWNDALLLNAAGRVCESAIANVFILKNGRLHTPPLSEGCVAGTMRRFLLEHLPAAGFPVQESEITTADLYAAEEVFLTNALRLLCPVRRCDAAEYGIRYSSEVFTALKKMKEIEEMWEI